MVLILTFFSVKMKLVPTDYYDDSDDKKVLLMKTMLTEILEFLRNWTVDPPSRAPYSISVYDYHYYHNDDYDDNKYDENEYGDNEDPGLRTLSLY